jgi:hypothetical protein
MGLRIVFRLSGVFAHGAVRCTTLLATNRASHAVITHVQGRDGCVGPRSAADGGLALGGRSASVLLQKSA